MRFAAADDDFGLRCGLQGLAGVYEPSAVAWHRGSASLGKWHAETVRLIARNQVWLAARHFPVRYWWPMVVAQVLWGGVAFRHGAGAAWMRGKWEGLGGFRRARGTAGQGAPLDALLREDEHTIYTLQTSTGFDFYWRLYFFLTQGEAK